MHMPGHKGERVLGPEGADITEISGADSLYEASGIIRESENNASRLFGCPTFYSAEGSSLSIRAMLYLILLYARERGHVPRVLAARNCHKSFVSAAALLDLDTEWLCGGGESYLSCRIDPSRLAETLDRADPPFDAVWVTSPDYLGEMADISALSEVCHSRGALLAVDCAHGAYLRFLSRSLFPIDLGADLCATSAHKTLPVLTGGGYLHISPSLDGAVTENAKTALSLFGSTSPSYLILGSLDAANALLADDYGAKIAELADVVASMRARLERAGFVTVGDEPLKLTFATKSLGYSGTEFAAALAERGIVIEFSDPDLAVLMLTPSVGEAGLRRLERELSALPRHPAQVSAPPAPALPERVMSIRRAVLSPRERVPISSAVGRVLADVSVGCPPAVPIAVSGERIDLAAARLFDYYGITECTVVKEL